MATLLSENKRVRDKYTITRTMNNGAMAVSYEARRDPEKSEPKAPPRKVFFKQYKSPSVRAPWYRPFIEYQEEMRRRISGPVCSRFCYSFLDSFEEKRCFYQVFEFLDHSHSLQKILDDCAKRPDSVKWPQRVIMSKVLMMGINALHQAKIVHSDLKPDNIMLIVDREIDAGYRVKIIDMDFSILTDVPPPWVGYEGFFGTPGYTSPEHFRREIPQLASDVFTCGLMLYELLAQGHPYRFDDMEKLSDAVLNYRAAPPKLRGEMTAPADTKLVAETIHRCLSPDPKARPTALEVNRVLNGTLGRTPPVPPTRPPTPPSRPHGEAGTPPKREERDGPTPPPAPPVPPPPPDRPDESPDPTGSKSLTLTSAAGKTKTLNVRTEFGPPLAMQLDRDDGPHWDHAQLTFEREDSGWYVVPRAGARNSTMLNGKAVTSRTKLNPGDVIGVGNEAKGIVKLPLKVSFE
ncbi:MAG: protein kinase [Isosphaeraceae bacterium]